MSTILHRRTVNVAISAAESAEELAGESSDVQAAWLLAFADAVRAWEKISPTLDRASRTWPMQCRFIVDEMDGIQRQHVAHVLSTLIDHLSEPAGDVCGFCNQPGADKIPHPVRWPGERSAGTELVHAQCEHEECRRAHEALTDEQRREFLRHV